MVGLWLKLCLRLRTALWASTVDYMYILVVDSSSLQVLKSFKIGSGSGATAVKSIEFARRGR